MNEAYVLPKSSQFVIRVALGQHADRVINQINHWLKANGPEWTVKRLKSIRTAAQQLKSCSDLSKRSKLRGGKEAKAIYQSESIAYRKDTLYPRGVFGPIVQNYVESRKPQATRRYDSVLRVYTAIILPELTASQYDKAKKAINTPSSATAEGLALGRSFVTRGWLYFKNRLPKELFTLEGKIAVKDADIRRLHPWTATHVSDSLRRADGLKKKPYGKLVESLISTTAWPKVFRTDEEGSGLYPYDIFDFIRSRVWANGTDNDYCGRISFMQQNGGKARVVAMPNAWLQWGFSPLHDALSKVIDQLDPWFCVFDQNNGAYFLQKVLGHREVIGSVDLSSATDRFPIELQLTLLNEMGLGDWAEALVEVANDDWLVNTSFGVETWHYKCGQPMGLYGSFPLFSLTYGCLVMGMTLELNELRLRQGKTPIVPEDAFRDLGDDMIVSNRELCNVLWNTLTMLGCEVSPSKTVISKVAGEFAGFAAYATNRGITTYRPYKHSDTKYVHNGVGFIHAVGSRLDTLPKRLGGTYWKQKFREYQLTKQWRYPDLSPILDLARDRCTPNEELIDTTRLVNLLEAALLESGSTSNSWTGDEFELFSLEDLALILLNQQYEEDEDFYITPRDIVVEGDIEQKKERYRGNGISEDPLMNYVHDEISKDTVDGDIKVSKDFDLLSGFNPIKLKKD